MNISFHTPCLTVCVACKGVSSLLKANLAALNHQTLDKRQWEIVLLVTEEHQLAVIEDILKSFTLNTKLLTCFHKNSLQELRNQALSSIKTPLLFFIDEDVILENTEHLKTLIHLHKKHPEEIVLGGQYLSTGRCSFFGQSYNWISCLWMLANPGLLPAGNLSVKTTHLNLKCRFKSPLPYGFGGEEMYFFKQLKATGGKSLWKKELDAPHWAFHTLSAFFNRAFVHGQSQAFQYSGGNFYQSAMQFIKQPGALKVKIPALCYLFLVKLTAFIYGLKRKIFISVKKV